VRSAQCAAESRVSRDNILCARSCGSGCVCVRLCGLADLRHGVYPREPAGCTVHVAGELAAEPTLRTHACVHALRARVCTRVCVRTFGSSPERISMIAPALKCVCVCVVVCVCVCVCACVRACMLAAGRVATTWCNGHHATSDAVRTLCGTRGRKAAQQCRFRCTALQHVALRCAALQHVALRCNTLRCVATVALRYTATVRRERARRPLSGPCTVACRVATCGTVAATCCNALRWIATRRAEP
jgi:hypothetical protein